MLIIWVYFKSGSGSGGGGTPATQWGGGFTPIPE